MYWADAPRLAHQILHNPNLGVVQRNRPGPAGQSHLDLRMAPRPSWLPSRRRGARLERATRSGTGDRGHEARHPDPLYRTGWPAQGVPPAFARAGMTMTIGCQIPNAIALPGPEAGRGYPRRRMPP